MCQIQTFNQIAVSRHFFRKRQFLPRYMECRRGLAMRILYVCLSVCLSVRRTCEL